MVLRNLGMDALILDVSPAEIPYLHMNCFHSASGIAHMPQIHWYICTKDQSQVLH
jgi:hypothetical protein